MRRLTFALLMVFLSSEAVRAGLYNPAEPFEVNSDFKVFKNTLATLRSIRLDKLIDPVQMRYMMMQQTAPRVIPPEWGTTQRLSLSEYLIRREKYQEAILLLKPLSRKEPGNFLVHSNLSAAYFLEWQEPALAIDYLDQALSSWPTKWDGLDGNMKQVLGQMGWDEIKFRNLREAETYQLKLIKLRRVEKVKGQAETLDDLFGVSFVGDSGSYEAGKLAAKEKAKLPNRALTIVQQLLIWSPNDPRLYWLLGEIYNARGERNDKVDDVATALEIFQSPELTARKAPALVVPGYRAPLLIEHMRILEQAPPPEKKSDSEKTTTPETDPNNPRKFDLRTLLVGVVVGIAVSIFAYWQFREIRRRRQGRTA